MSEESRIISMKQVLEITDGMPFYLQTKPWRTEYAGPHVILIKDSGKKVFGGFLLSSWRLSKNEFSDREKQFWLSAYTNHTRIFKRTQKNRRLQMADETGFSIGAGENQGNLIGVKLSIMKCCRVKVISKFKHLRFG
ncbi:unnamed protein product [Paramecium octaurelia]|uniref:TLDc domain-containing protein n=1 Tax=Paramecium octaurelia TaxID=43137 RepID=A0A8S1WDL7_PAROT|nr:unnamed protein product [Paramecium octaurelia]